MQNKYWAEFEKKNPHLVPFLKFTEQLNKESPRGAALIACGFLEQQLKDVLLAYIAPNKGAAALFDGSNAPFGTFSARINACYALRLIEEVEYLDLQLLRRIRNEFAHKIEISFEDSRISAWCSELRSRAPDYTHPELGEVILPPSAKFTTAAAGLIIGLVNRAHYVAIARPSTTTWPR